jgi:hypothetical protein
MERCNNVTFQLYRAQLTYVHQVLNRTNHLCRGKLQITLGISDSVRRHVW